MSIYELILTMVIVGVILAVIYMIPARFMPPQWKQFITFAAIAFMVIWFLFKIIGLSGSDVRL